MQHESSHLSLQDLVALCDETRDPEHVLSCDRCRSRLDQARAIERALVSDLLHHRPFCLGTDELADLPPGAEHVHPHLVECPMCRDDLRILQEMEAEESLGMVAMPGFPMAAVAVEVGDFRLHYQAAGDLEVPLDQGPLSAEQDVGDRHVVVRVVPPDLEIDVADKGHAELELQLENSFFVESRALSVGVQRLPIGDWRLARVLVKS